jgi:plastocyanin
MKSKAITVIAIGAALALPALSFAKENEEEENLQMSDVPAMVQKAANREAKGGRIVRWEKERGNYEAVIEKGGKQWGVQISTNGKVLGKHDESKESAEKHEKE